MAKAANGWFKTYTRLYREAAVIEGGHQVAHVYTLLLAIATEHGRTGDINARLCTPRALQRYFYASDYPAELLQEGLDGCEAAGWIRREGDTVVLTGFEREYGPPPKSNAERVREHRARRAAESQNAPTVESERPDVTECNARNVTAEPCNVTPKPCNAAKNGVTHVTPTRLDETRRDETRRDETRRDETRPDDIIVSRADVRAGEALPFDPVTGGAKSNNNNDGDSEGVKSAINAWARATPRRGLSMDAVTIDKIRRWVDTYGAETVVRKIGECHGSADRLTLNYVSAALENEAKGRGKRGGGPGVTTQLAPLSPLDGYVDPGVSFDEVLARVEGED